MTDHARRAADLSCGDSSCMYGHPGGMATNGGCRCHGKGGWMSSDEARNSRRKARQAAALLHESEARVRELEEALRPFAKRADIYREDAPGESTSPVLLMELRDARRALGVRP